ncbi:DUF4911 domain-containing protein [Calderihabitans maritimus]|uniref:Peptidase, U32 family protein n=1 Tax=Calderihabitans maritimus TaxID=1246530 RepID=A0A1Z5HXF2_9FIRM|nr:DUF4911 domain-containing protein [Calderihabitans maritimus]GAW94213.1 peptidase, U32 family protein [Calderihabitans maritimus]
MEAILVQVNPKEIDFLNKIIEGYDGLAMVTTADAKEGLVEVHVTPDTREEVIRILEDFPVPVKILRR